MIAQALCVLCRHRPAHESWYPFCSERCKLQDLARWLDGVYRVPDVAEAASRHADAARRRPGEQVPPEDPGSKPDSNSEDS